MRAYRLGFHRLQSASLRSNVAQVRIGLSNKRMTSNGKVFISRCLSLTELNIYRVILHWWLITRMLCVFVILLSWELSLVVRRSGRRFWGSSQSGFSTIDRGNWTSLLVLGCLCIVISCTLLNDQPIRVWLRLYWDQAGECDLANLTIHGFARPSFSKMCLFDVSHKTCHNVGSCCHTFRQKPEANYENQIQISVAEHAPYSDLV